MLDSLVSWHRGTSLPKMISSIKDRRLWTNMIINAIWKKNYSHSIGSSCYALTFTLPTDTIKSINIPRWVKLFCSRLVLFFNTPHLIPGLWYTHKLIHGMIIWWAFFFFFRTCIWVFVTLHLIAICHCQGGNLVSCSAQVQSPLSLILITNHFHCTWITPLVMTSPLIRFTLTRILSTICELHSTSKIHWLAIICPLPLGGTSTAVSVYFPVTLRLIWHLSYTPQWKHKTWATESTEYWFSPVEAITGPTALDRAPSDLNIPMIVPFSSSPPYIDTRVVKHGPTVADASRHEDTQSHFSMLKIKLVININNIFFFIFMLHVLQAIVTAPTS